MEVTIRIPSGDGRLAVLGAADRNLKIIREVLGVNITSRDGNVRLNGDRDAVHIAKGVLDRLASRSGDWSRQQVLELISDESSRHTSGASITSGPGGFLGWEGDLSVYAGGRRIAAKTINQQAYLDAIRDHDLVFGIGPAGTGKTYLAVAAAVHLLKQDSVKKVMLVRPAVEAGEKLGFLPGDMEAKVNPYLRPLLDALHDMVDFQTIRRFIDSDVVEIVPLAYMRGRTLNNAVIILDEAQNTTSGQMKMFLTRMGHGSKMIVTGDVTQIDLPDPTVSGLIDAARRLRRVSGVAMVYLDRTDVVRHPLVQRVIDAYGEDRDGAAGEPPASS
ncbi:MAG: PhoH family protein [Phycisphaeraceae bacterium]|nr:PhoH family protein [Phycisphaeraceae bacterium]MCW5754808.1 PhoH family protein [Phycisphaeraceae bacterium]